MIKNNCTSSYAYFIFFSLLKRDIARIYNAELLHMFLMSP